MISIGSGCVADIAEPRERGKYTAFFQVGAMCGPALGPLIGGILAQTLGWRSIFWFLTISCGVVLVPLILWVLLYATTTIVLMDSFMPETLRSLVGDGSIPPPTFSMSPMMLFRKRQMDKDLKSRGEDKVHIDRPPPRPVSLAPIARARAHGSIDLGRRS